MLGLTQGSGPSESKAIFDLLAIVSDPVSAKTRLDELLKALADAKESVVKADAREKTLLKLDQEVSGRLNAVTSAERALGMKSKEVEQEGLRLSKLKNDLVMREEEFSTREVIFNNEVKIRKASLEEQEKLLISQGKEAAAMNKVENEKLVRRANALDEVERKLKVKEDAFENKKKAVETAIRAVSA